MSLEDNPYFSGWKRMQEGISSEEEALSRSVRQRKEDNLAIFNKYQEAVAQGDKTTGDRIQDWFVVNYLREPVVDENFVKLVQNWKKASEESARNIGKLVMSREQWEQQDCALHVMIPHSGQENKYVYNLKERRRIGVLTDSVQFDTPGKQIILPMENHVIMPTDERHDGKKIKEAKGSMSFNPSVDFRNFLEGRVDYRDLGKILESKHGMFELDDLGRAETGLSLFFGQQVEDHFVHRRMHSEFYKVSNLLGVEVEGKFKDAYQQEMTRGAHSVLCDVEKLRANETNFSEQIRQRAGREDNGYLANCLERARKDIMAKLASWKTDGDMTLPLPFSLIDSSKEGDLRDKINLYCTEYKVA